MDDQVAEAGGKTIHWDVLTKDQNAVLSQVAREGNVASLREAFKIRVTDRMDPLALQRAKQAQQATDGPDRAGSGQPLHPRGRAV